MYYVLMTDLVRVPSPVLESNQQYLLGLSITGHMAQNSPDTAPRAPGSPSPAQVADADLSTRVQNLKAAAGSSAAIASELGPIAPWTWTSFDAVMLTDGTTTLQVPLLAAPTLDGVSFAALQGAISAHLDYNHGEFFTDYPGQMSFRGRDVLALATQQIQAGSNLFSYEGFVASLAAAPSPLPHGQMNLVRFFTVSANQLGTLSHAQNHVAAIPVFTANGTSFAGATLSNTSYFIADPANNVAQWLYYNKFSGFSVVAFTQVRDPRAPMDSKNSFVNMDTLWVRRQHDNTGPSGVGDPRIGVALDDWIQHLPAKLATLFDLPRRFLDLFRDQNGTLLAFPLADPSNPAKPDLLASRRLVHGTLRALYDVLAPGIWGDQATGRSDVATTTLRVVYPTGPASQVSNVIANLWAQSHNVRAGFALGPFGDWQPPTKVFCDVLAARVGPPLGLPAESAGFVSGLFAVVGSPAGPASPQSDTISTNLTILDRLVTLATSPDMAVAIYADLWSKANLGEADVTDVVRQLGLPDAQRRQIASFALSQAGIFNTSSAAGPDTDLLRSNILACVAGYLRGTLTAAPNTLSAPTPPNVDPEAAFAGSDGRSGSLDRNQIPDMSATSPFGSAIDTAVKAWLPQALKASQYKSFDFVPASATTATATGLNFQIDRVVLGTGTGLQDDFNFLLAGYAFLMRRALRSLNSGQDPRKRVNWHVVKESTWRLLNAVQGAAGARGPGPGEQPAQRFHASGSPSQPLELISPTPIATSAGMPQASLQYNNSPLAGSNVPSEVTHTASPEMADAAPNLFHLIQPILQDSPPTRQLLPFLAFGLSYDLVTFGITNQGALPEKLRGVGTPTVPAFPAAIPAGDPDVESILASGSENFDTLVRSVRYLRTTSVGHLSLDTDLKRGVAPRPVGYDPFQAPKGLALIAAEIKGLRRTVDAASLSSQAASTGGRKSCLLLGRPSGASAWKADQRNFAISAPACPLDVLDRWLARDEFYPASGVQESTIGQLRRHIRQLYVKANRDQQTAYKANNVGLLGRDTAKIEDPAVGGLVVTTQLYRRAGKDVAGSASSTFFPWPSKFDQFLHSSTPPPLPTSLAGFCRPDAIVDFSITAAALPTGQVSVTGQSGNTFEVKLAMNAGDVVLVSFQPAALDDYFQVDEGLTARFDPMVLPVDAGSVTYVDPSGTNMTYRLFDPIEIVVEAAQPNLPAPDALYTACGFEVASENGQRQIFLDWTRPNPDDVTWDAVGAIETGDVAWSFTGRPVTRYPFEETQADKIPGSQDTPETNPLLWEVEAFADRATLAPAVKIFPIPLSSAGGKKRIPIQLLGARGPAGVKRYEVIVLNRYAAAYQQVPASQKVGGSGVEANMRAKHTQPSATPPNNTWVDSYRRLVVRAVPPDNVPEPTVRALVPLTRNMDDTGGANVAGLLVILDGAFGDVGGVAEWLDAGVDIVQRELPVAADDPTRVVVRRAEIGADPLLRPYPRGIDPAKPKQGYRFLPLRAAGPLGHTFDTAATVGLFNATSFVIEPPQIAAADPGAWWMAKLKLRRTIMAEGIAQQTPVSLSQSHATLPSDDPSGKPQGYLNQWSLSLIGLPLPAQSTTPQTIGLSLQRIGNNAALLGGAQTLLVCWAKDSVGQLAIWLTSTAPTAIPDEAWRIPIPQNANTIPTGLRLTFAPTLRRIQIWDDSTSTMSSKVVLSYNAALQLRTTGEWVFAGDFDLWNDHSSYLPDGTYEQRLQLSLSWQGTLLQSAQSTFVCVAPQVSDWVVSHWGQFLPEANRLVSLPAVVVALEQHPIGLRITGADWWLYASDLAAKHAARNADQGLLHLVMLSRSVRSANGRDSEAYQGLFWDGGKAASSTLKLEHFGSSPTIELSVSSNDFRWRLLTVRTTKPSVVVADIQSALAADPDPWRLFFPPERDGGVNVVPDHPSDATMMPCDAFLQIIEISGHRVVQQ